MIALKQSKMKQLHVNALWRFLSDLSFIMQCTVVVVCPVAGFHITANCCSRTMAQRTHLKKNNKTIFKCEFANTVTNSWGAFQFLSEKSKLVIEKNLIYINFLILSPKSNLNKIILLVLFSLIKKYRLV